MRSHLLGCFWSKYGFMPKYENKYLSQTPRIFRKIS